MQHTTHNDHNVRSRLHKAAHTYKMSSCLEDGLYDILIIDVEGDLDLTESKGREKQVRGGSTSAVSALK